MRLEDKISVEKVEFSCCCFFLKYKSGFALKPKGFKNLSYKEK